MVTAADPSELTDARLRRAISTAYYAVFHTVLHAAAKRFMGSGSNQSPGYRILYRSFDHAQMAKVCGEIRKVTLRDSYRRTLGRTAVSPDACAFANGFLSLQEARHRADYDPGAPAGLSDAMAAITEAEADMAAFHRVPPDEQSDVLALMMVRLRD